MTSQYNENYKGTFAFSDTCFQVGLNASAEKTVTVPGDKTMQFQALFGFNSSANVYVALNATPVIPTLGTTGSQPYSEFRPHKRYVRGGDVIHFITPDVSAYFGVSLRQLQG